MLKNLARREAPPVLESLCRRRASRSVCDEMGAHGHEEEEEEISECNNLRTKALWLLR